MLILELPSRKFFMEFSVRWSTCDVIVRQYASFACLRINAWIVGLVRVSTMLSILSDGLPVASRKLVSSLTVSTEFRTVFLLSGA